MRSLFAAVLLFLQLQPVLGAAACLGILQQPQQAECEMPENESNSSEDLSSIPISPQSCPIAALCATPTLTVPGLSDLPEIGVALGAALPPSSPTRPLDAFTAPPFHPPKV